MAETLCSFVKLSVRDLSRRSYWKEVFDR